MIYSKNKGQFNYGEAIGIILLENWAPFIPGDIANATTFSFPVRYQLVSGLTPERIFKKDMNALDIIIRTCNDLKQAGVRAITSNCGFYGNYQKEVAEEIDLPIFLSSLLQIPFMLNLIAKNYKIGIITASASALDDSMLNSCGASELNRIVISGLEDKCHFNEVFLQETKSLNTDLLENEVIESVNNLVATNPNVKLILLECSVLPPYSKAVWEATGLPVFDFTTMINYVFNAVIKSNYVGHM